MLTVAECEPKRMFMSVFDSLHCFLDESGYLQGTPKKGEPLLVGGLLVFGEYGDAADMELREHVARRLCEVGGVFS